MPKHIILHVSDEIWEQLKTQDRIHINLTNKNQIITQEIIENKLSTCINIIANNYNVTIEDLRSKKHDAQIVEARQVCCFVLSKFFAKKEIKNVLNRNHINTVNYSIYALRDKLLGDKELTFKIENLHNSIKGICS